MSLGPKIRVLRTILLKPDIRQTLVGPEETGSERGRFFTEMSRLAFQQKIGPVEFPR